MTVEKEASTSAPRTAEGARTGNWLRNTRARNVQSQDGEDGILEAIFETVPTANPWCVEFGAWDGRQFSNTWNLIRNHGWSAVLIERDQERFRQLALEYGNRPDVHCLHASIALHGPQSLDTTLAGTPVPKDLDLLSIDIDGNDYHVWDSLRAYRPKVVVIEFNPTIPNSVDFVQSRDPRVNQGSSLSAMIRLALTKGYEPVALTGWNAFFVCAELFPRFGITDNSIGALRPSNPYESKLYQLFDGTLVIDGYRELIWHGVTIRDRDVQVLPRFLRFGLGQHKSQIMNLAQRVWLAVRRRSPFR
jgi:hypothetical protein